MKIIVTHFAPDVDAVTSIWLLKRFLPGWEDAEVAFVPAGSTLNGDIVDSDKDILHVDTGMGILDHHQTDEDTCAARRTLEFVGKSQISNLSASGGSHAMAGRDKSQSRKGKISKINNKFPDEALERLIDVVNDIDHFREVYFPNPTADYYDFGLVGILDGWKLIYGEDYHRITELGLILLDGIYKKFQDRVWAEKEIKENGIEFTTKWGKGMAVETINDETVRLSQRMGYTVAVRKDPKKDYVRIKVLPESDANLTACYNKYKRIDPEASWYLHVSKKMILNGSMKNPRTKATKLTLREIIDVLKKR